MFTTLAMGLVLATKAIAPPTVIYSQASMVNGKSVVRYGAMTGYTGIPRAATKEEIAYYKIQDPMKTAGAPAWLKGSAFEFTCTNDLENGLQFSLVNKKAGKTLVSHRSFELDGLCQDVNLHSLSSDGRFATLIANSHITSEDFYEWHAYDTVSKRLTKFFGTLNPVLPYALVVGNAKEVTDVDVHVHADKLYESRGHPVYVIDRPKDITNYNFNKATGKRLIKGLKSINFHRSPSFSKDGWWALSGNILIDIKGARARTLPDSAIFYYPVAGPKLPVDNPYPGDPHTGKISDEEKPRVKMYRWNVFPGSSDGTWWEMTGKVSGTRVAIITHGIMNQLVNPKKGDIGFYNGDLDDLALHLSKLKDYEGKPFYDAVYGVDYNWKAHIQSNAVRLRDVIKDICRPEVETDLYGHSMGGVLLRCITDLELQPSPASYGIKRLFTLGTPHKGVPAGALKQAARIATKHNYDSNGVHDLYSDAQVIARLNNSFGSKDLQYIFAAGNDHASYKPFGLPVGSAVNTYYNSGAAEYEVPSDGIVSVDSAYMDALSYGNRKVTLLGPFPLNHSTVGGKGRGSEFSLGKQPPLIFDRAILGDPPKPPVVETLPPVTENKEFLTEEKLNEMRKKRDTVFRYDQFLAATNPGTNGNLDVGVLISKLDRNAKNQNLGILGDARGSTDLFLVPASNWRVGAAWHRTWLSISDTYDIEFDYTVDKGGGLGNGADGFAFVFQSEGVKALGDKGGGIGYSGISRAIALEFDAYYNSEYNDPEGDHVELFSSSQSISSDHERNGHSAHVGIPVLDGKKHHVRITVSPTSIRLYLDNSTKPVRVWSVNLETAMKGSKMLVGFTAATGSGHSQVRISKWRAYVLGG